MSSRELGLLVPKSNSEITGKKLTKLISEILKNKAAKKHGAIKYLSNLTGIETNTLKKWHNGTRAPDLSNFITLAYYIPEIIQLFLELCNQPEIWDAHQSHNYLLDIINKKAKLLKYQEVYSDIFLKNHVTINFSVLKKLPNKLNKRQEWFLQKLQAGETLRLNDIITKWSITARTASRDIDFMKQRGLIKFVGSKKFGKYYIQV